MSCFGLEFPQGTQAREDLLSTLVRLNIYKPEPSWEDAIMDVYLKSLKNFGLPTTALVNPKDYKLLKKQIK